MASFSGLKNQVFSQQLRRQHYIDHVLGLNAFDRHKKFIHDYAQFYGHGRGSTGAQRPIKTDHDTLKETYRFLRTEDDDSDNSWEQRLARRYYEKLFKEYCLADMSRYKEGKIGLRWRTEKEVVSGKGQFGCGAKGCEERKGLHSYEVNFAYREAGEEKQALVKLRVCPKHAYRLNYRKEKEREKRRRQEEKKARKRPRKETLESSNGGDSSGREGGKSEGSEEEKSESDNENASGDKTRGGDTEGQKSEIAESNINLAGGTLPDDSSIWRGKRPELEPKKDEEFDDYFRGMFL